MRHHTAEVSRYVANGLLATIVHYGVLNINLSIVQLKSAGLANFIAAFFGIVSSFIGNRYFVFNRTTESIKWQAFKFGGLYLAFAFVHGVFLWLWTDWHGLDYRVGFLLSTAIQMSMSYVANKFVVFRP
jgi:putative flippase GtrA